MQVRNQTSSSSLWQRSACAHVIALNEIMRGAACGSVASTVLPPPPPRSLAHAATPPAARGRSGADSTVDRESHYNDHTHGAGGGIGSKAGLSLDDGRQLSASQPISDSSGGGGGGGGVGGGGSSSDGGGSQRITSQPINTQPINTQPINTQPITSQPITLQPTHGSSSGRVDPKVSAAIQLVLEEYLSQHLWNLPTSVDDVENDIGSKAGLSLDDGRQLSASQPISDSSGGGGGGGDGPPALSALRDNALLVCVNTRIPSRAP
jgi:hypothetical protein